MGWGALRAARVVRSMCVLLGSAWAGDWGAGSGTRTADARGDGAKKGRGRAKSEKKVTVPVVYEKMNRVRVEGFA